MSNFFFGFVLSFVSLLCTSLMALPHPQSGGGIAVDSGPGVSGGGDECENRIKLIAEDLQSWIRAGGARGLNLPPNLSSSAYETAMQAEIEKAKFHCVGPGDQGYPVEVLGAAKTCRFDKYENSSRITCDYSKFRDLSEEEQYVLVHHEFAGLAGIEPALGDESRYEISNQIAAFLEETIVKKLVVNPRVDEKALCEEGIRNFIETQFPSDDSTGEVLPLTSIRIDKVEFIDATGMVDIEAHALFDEDGFVATRIFMEAEGIWEDQAGGEWAKKGCRSYKVKASFSNPLAE